LHAPLTPTITTTASFMHHRRRRYYRRWSVFARPSKRPWINLQAFSLALNSLRESREVGAGGRETSLEGRYLSSLGREARPRHLQQRL
jgi:hypothetical protein